MFLWLQLIPHSDASLCQLLYSYRQIFLRLQLIPHIDVSLCQLLYSYRQMFLRLQLIPHSDVSLCQLLYSTVKCFFGLSSYLTVTSVCVSCYILPSNVSSVSAHTSQTVFCRQILVKPTTIKFNDNPPSDSPVPCGRTRKSQQSLFQRLCKHA